MTAQIVFETEGLLAEMTSRRSDFVVASAPQTRCMRGGGLGWTSGIVRRADAKIVSVKKGHLVRRSRRILKLLSQFTFVVYPPWSEPPR